MGRRIVDTASLAALIAERTGCSSVELRRLDVACAWPVYRAKSADDRPQFFVKVASRDAACRTVSFLHSCGACGLFARLVVDEPIAFGDQAVLCLEWKDAQRVNAEDMTDEQVDGFLSGCVRLSDALGCAHDFRKASGEDNPDAQYEALRGYATEHRFVGRFLDALVGIPAVQRSYRGRWLTVIHGDLHAGNYGFDGDRFSAVFDFDALTLGLSCEDAAYAFCERARKSSLGWRKRRRLCVNFERMVKASPWRRDEWLVAVNHCRLRIAHRRLQSHPNAAFVALDIWRRDRPIRCLIGVLEKLDA